MIDIYFRVNPGAQFTPLGTFDVLECLRIVQTLRDAGCEVRTVRWPEDYFQGLGAGTKVPALA
jgi:hypothetical protein